MIRLTSVALLLFLIAHLSPMLRSEEPNRFAPQAEHKLLTQFVGKWRFVKKSMPAEGKPFSEVGSGEFRGEMLGDFFMVARWSGSVYGTSLRAVQILGYDVSAKEYVGSWVDSTMNHRWKATGQVNSKSQELVIAASGPAPNGETCELRERYEFESPTKIKITSERKQGDAWAAFMTTHLSRQSTK